MLLLRAFVPAWREKEKGKAHRCHVCPGRGVERTPGADQSSPTPLPGGTRDHALSPRSPPRPVCGLTRVTLAGEGARRPCPAVLADRLFLCFDTCAHCPMLLSLIYRPIKGSAFLKPPALFPSAPSSLRGGGGGLECGAETLLSPPPAPAPRPDPYHASLHKRSLDGVSAGSGSPATAWEATGRDGDAGSKLLLSTFPFLFLLLHACVIAGPRVPAASRRGPEQSPDGAAGPGTVPCSGEPFQPGTANSQTHWWKTRPGKAPQLSVPLN